MLEVSLDELVRNKDIFTCYLKDIYHFHFCKMIGLVRDLNPGPLAPKARIIPLDQRATLDHVHYDEIMVYFASFIINNII